MSCPWNEDGLFFTALGRLHPRYRTPAWAIGILGGWACVLLLATAMAIASFLKSDWISRILGPGVLMAGVVVFFLYRRFRREAD
ncbi:MAG: hypothetical protein O7F11_02865 [Acidobacteria bacterium]|nr:hypothetical protein [Acidobacteriota bacterium]